MTKQATEHKLTGVSYLFSTNEKGPFTAGDEVSFFNQDGEEIHVRVVSKSVHHYPSCDGNCREDDYEGMCEREYYIVTSDDDVNYRAIEVQVQSQPNSLFESSRGWFTSKTVLAPLEDTSS